MRPIISHNVRISLNAMWSASCPLLRNKNTNDCNIQVGFRLQWANPTSYSKHILLKRKSHQLFKLHLPYRTIFRSVCAYKMINVIQSHRNKEPASNNRYRINRGRGSDRHPIRFEMESKRYNFNISFISRASRECFKRRIIWLHWINEVDANKLMSAFSSF